MTRFGKTDKEKLAAYLQEKYRELTGDPSVTVSYNGKTKEVPAMKMPALHRFKVEFPKGISLNLPNGTQADALIDVCRFHQHQIMPLFDRGELQKEERTGTTADIFKQYGIYCDADAYRPAEDGSITINIACSDIAIAKTLAEKSDSIVFKRAQSLLQV